MKLALLLSALSGFIALSYEILWVRAWTFVTQATASSFAILLGWYLVGLGIGALWSLRYRDQEDAANPAQLRAVAAFIGGANVGGFLLVPVMSLAVVFVPPWTTLPLVALAAAALGVSFPLLCHLAVRPDHRAGAGLSYLYLANIIGSTVGSLVTGFVLLDHLTLADVSVWLAAAGLVSAALLARHAAAPRLGGAFGLLAVVVLVAGHLAYAGVYERLQRKTDYVWGERFTHMVETKSGVVTVDADRKVYGGGAYDGKVELSLRDWGWIVRPYALSAYHPAPRDVLLIGLSSGVWARIVASNPAVETLAVVEINRGYIELIGEMPRVRSLLTDPKVTTHIDDGRRWLRRNPERKFDAIVFNVTHHWRAYAANVLSREFLEQVRGHLKPGGVYLYNSTFSKEAQRTALEVFPHVNMVVNTMVASDAPLRFDRERWRENLTRYAIDGAPVFALPADAARLDEVVQMPFGGDDPIRLWTRAQLETHTAGATVVTDDNMATEW